MNKVILMGRLTKAPEIKYLQDDNKTAMARYTLAVDRRYGKDREREEDFISCVTFGKNAEFAELYLKKGTKIVISGRIRTGSYTDSEGVKRYSSNVVVEEHFFAESKKALTNYNFVVNVLKKEEFSHKKVDDVKLSDAKIFLIKLQRDGRGYSSIHSIRGVLRPAFQMAVDDDLILKNPFGFELGTILVNDSQKREAVSLEDETRFLEFVKNDPHYNRYYDAFLRILKNRKKTKKEPTVDGFLFLDKNGNPMVALHWEKYMQHAREKYNKEHLLQLPLITPHICRHSYCTNMANSGMNPKTLQYLMGHSDVSVTLNIYTHTGYDDAKKELARLKEAKKELDKNRFVTQKHAQITHE